MTADSYDYCHLELNFYRAVTRNNIMEIFFKVPCSVKTMSKYFSVECSSDIQKSTALLEGSQALLAWSFC